MNKAEAKINILSSLVAFPGKITEKLSVVLIKAFKQPGLFFSKVLIPNLQHSLLQNQL